MALGKGNLMPDGTIFGEFGLGSMGVQGVAVLHEVAQALRTHHRLPVTFNPDTYRVSPYCPYGQTTPTARAGEAGTVLRVISGSCDVKVGVRTLYLDYGDWAYIPPGASYTCTANIMGGVNLRFASGALRRT